MNCNRCGKGVYMTQAGICLQCIHDMHPDAQKAMGRMRIALDKLERAQIALEGAKAELNASLAEVSVSRATPAFVTIMSSRLGGNKRDTGKIEIMLNDLSGMIEYIVAVQDHLARHEGAYEKP